MKAGMTPALIERLRRADPGAGFMVDADVVVQEDVKRRKDQWQGADSTAGLELFDDGSVKIAGSTDVLSESTTEDSDLTTLRSPKTGGEQVRIILLTRSGSTATATTVAAHQLDVGDVIRVGGAEQNEYNGDFTVTTVLSATSFEYTVSGTPATPATGTIIVQLLSWFVCAVEGTVADTDRMLTEVVAELDPDTGGGKQVATWLCQPYAVVDEIGTDLIGGLFPEQELAPLADPIRVTAPLSKGPVTFTFTGPDFPPAFRIGRSGPQLTYLFIWGVQADGTRARNVAWRVDSAKASHANGGFVLSQRKLTASQVTGASKRVFDEGNQGAGTPKVTIRSRSFTQQTLAFTGANEFNLGAAPVETVEFAIEGNTPAGTAITAQVRNDADTAWVTFQDGDTPADLAGVSARQQYEIQVVFDPDSNGTATPVLRALGVRDRARTDLSNLVVLRGGDQSVDPKTLKGEIAELVLTVITDGDPDFRDRITELLATMSLGRLEFRVAIGASDLPRKDWLPVDTYVPDDYEAVEGGIALVCNSQLFRLRQVLPAPIDVGGGVTEREPVRYTAQTLKTVWDDIIQNQVDLPARYRGPGLEDAATTVSNVIEDSDAKAELDALAYLAGAAIITSQSAIKVVNMLDRTRGIVHVFRTNEVKPLRLSPGYRHRVPEFYVPWGYDFEHRVFTAEQRSFHGQPLSELGVALLEAPPVLEDRIARWIHSLALAQTVGSRVVQTQGAGLLSFPFVSNYAYPEIECGDRVAVGIEGFVARDPIFGQSYRGPLYAVGVVHEASPDGRRFAVWVQSYADLFEAFETVDRGRHAVPAIHWEVDDVPGSPGTKVVLLVGVPFTASLFYVIQNDGDTVPAYGAAAWRSYTGPFLVNRLETTDRQVSFYAEHGALRSARTTILIDQDTLPEVSVGVSEPAAGTARVTLAPDDDVVFNRLYRKKWVGGLSAGNGEGHPVLGVGQTRSVSSITRSGSIATMTTAAAHGRKVGDIVLIAGANETEYNGTFLVVTVPSDTTFTYTLVSGTPATPATGTITWDDTRLDHTQLVGTIYVQPDGGAWDANGGPLSGMVGGQGVGGTQWEETGYSANDVIAVLVVPVDRRGNPGPRATVRQTITGSAGPALTTFISIQTRSGSSCSDKAQLTASWTVNAGVSDGSHDLKVYLTRDGYRTLEAAITDPATTLSTVITLDDYEDFPVGIPRTFQLDYELVDGVPTVLDAGAAKKHTIYMSGECAA